MIDEDTHEYDDIIALPHHTSATRPHMSDRNRAAQFAPFAALTGYEDAVKESGRLTGHRIIPDEEAAAQLDAEFAELTAHIPEHPDITVTYFVQDMKKDGGEYETYTGKVRIYEEYTKTIIFTDGTRINADDIICIRINSENI